MSDVWVVVVVVGVVTVLFRASGPLFLGGRPLPDRVVSVIDLLAPVMLISLVTTQTFGSGDDVTLDARLPGVAVAAIAIWRRVPIIAAMAIAAVVTALVRLAT